MSSAIRLIFTCTYISLRSTLISVQLLLLSTHYIIAHVLHACFRVAFAYNYLRIDTLYSSKIKAPIDRSQPEISERSLTRVKMTFCVLLTVLFV